MVQQAYEVLSDPQERAWYDNHREQILKGSSNNTNYTDNSLDIFQYFTTSCFKGYGDDPESFYSVYAKVFETIASEDIEYMESENEYDEIPKFGNSESDYDTIVGPFYGYWMSYSTKKSYCWLDPYNIRDTRDRRCVKLIEKENKKVRLKARKERNEEIRNLVAFIRKRDKRVQAHNKFVTDRNLDNRKKQQEIRKQRILERTKELSKAKEKEQEWSKFDNMQSELKEIEKHLAAEFGDCLSESDGTDSVEELGIDESNLYCIACNKMFKTVNAFNNHETSKKHRENVDKIKDEFSDENISNDDPTDTKQDLNDVESIPDDILHEHLSDDEIEQISTSKKKKNKTKKKAMVHESDNESDFDLGLSKKQLKKLQREQNILANRELENTEATDTGEETEVINSKSDEVSTNPETVVVKDKVKKNKKVKVPLQVNDNIDLTHNCAICKQTFSSKNKLFDHLKKTGHSTALPQQVASGNKKPKRTKKYV